MHNEPVAQAGAPLAEARKVLVMLHGRGGNARAFIELAGKLNLNTAEYAVVAPQAIGNSWYPYGFMEPVQRNEPQLSLSLSAIAELLDDLGAFALAPEDVYFLGFSQGACLMLEYCARHARRYGGVIAFTGGLIGPRLDTSRYRGSFAGTPIFVGASDYDPHVPEHRVHETEAVLGKMDAKVIKKIYPGMGHAIGPDELKIADLILNDQLTHYW
ncbi:MAG: alpha/beta fold hydrolase [Cytophagales bacterium]|nr:alpha/beta fold hydrolase [Cytophagales bacterium]